jgi:hypothetical protein
VEIIEAVCCVSGSLNYVEDIRSKTGADSLAAAVRSNDTPAIFDWMMDSFSYQGISNRVADQYIRQHGNATWRQIARLLASSPPCPRLVNYWSFDGCRYDKTSQCCAEPEHMDRCPVPTHRLRNGRLNQAAYDFFSSYEIWQPAIFRVGSMISWQALMTIRRTSTSRCKTPSSIRCATSMEFQTRC